jgi:hypothetical protein
MSGQKPLAAAAERLRGRPGRPRKAKPKVERPRIDPRLLNVKAGAAYLGVSAWTVRDLAAAGVLHRVRIPMANNGELRKVLFDREDLDRLIAAWKGR